MWVTVRRPRQEIDDDRGESLERLAHSRRPTNGLAGGEHPALLISDSSGRIWAYCRLC
jgi:hypothetical protein